MSRSAEQIALDEKIARIRKQNEEIIRRKQIIDEEIKNAERHNAIVNIKKTYSDEDEDDKPSLYADSLSTRQPKTTVTYPKMKVTQVCRNDRERSKHEDVAWRREREQIDNERIRRQKAASGWRREWDANKTLENEKESVVESSQRLTSRLQRGRSNEYGDNRDRMVSSSSSQGSRPPADAGDPWKVDRDTSYRSQPRNQQTATYKSYERKPINPGYSVSNRSSLKSETPNDSESTRSWRGKEGPGNLLNDARSTTMVAENKPTTWQTSILRRATSVEDKPNIVITNVTKCQETKTLPWKNEFSILEEDSTESLSKRLKNIVIHVKNDNVKEAGRVVELVDKASTHAERTSSTSSTIQPSTTNKSSPAAGILKKSLEVTRSDEFQPKKSVIILENDNKNEKSNSVPTTEVADGDSDSEWEDVDDDESEWEDIPD